MVNHYLEQINKHQQLNAFVEVYAEEAIQKAIALDAKQKKTGITGKLHGVVIGIKDVLAYKDHTLTAASKILKILMNSPWAVPTKIQLMETC